MLNNVKFIQKVLIKKGDDFLFLQRSSTDDVNPNEWDLPGGNVKAGENLQVALNREVSEETNVSIETAYPKFLASFDQDGTYVIAAIYIATYIKGEVILSNEHQNYSWVAKDNILELNLQSWLKNMFISNIEGL